MAGARGENVIDVEGRGEIPILFTNRALIGAEKRLGKGIIGILQGFSNGESGMTEVAILLHVGMEAARVDAKLPGKPLAMSDAYDVLDRIGFAGAAGPVMEAIAEVIGYSGDGGESEIDADPNV